MQISVAWGIPVISVLARSRGEYVLFLDDDTVILQEDFLSKLLDVFQSNPNIDALVPHGNASFGLVKGKYDFHDPYFMTSRCTAYRRSVLAELGGFVDDFIGQEDVEYRGPVLHGGEKSAERFRTGILPPAAFGG